MGGLYYGVIYGEMSPISTIKKIAKSTLYLPGKDQGSAAMWILPIGLHRTLLL